MDSVGSRLTVAIVPRQRWSMSVKSLDATIAVLPEGTELVYVDGGSPADIEAELRRRVDAYGGTYVRVDCVLSPNEARNLAAAEVTREFVIIHDNDVFPEPGWAEALVRCADETGAGMVGPLVMHGPKPHSDEIHIAGGTLNITEDRVMDQNTRDHNHRKIGDVEEPIVRGPSRQIEFHSCLIRTEAMRQILPFDEGLWSMADHEDVTLQIEDLGYPLMFEPESVVTYVLMALVDKRERGYWQLRWSNEWNGRSFDHFCDKWDLQRHKGWPEWAELWARKERTWWMHRQNSVYTTLGKGLRFANRSTFVSGIVTPIEEAVLNRDAKAEKRRRESVLGHA